MKNSNYFTRANKYRSVIGGQMLVIVNLVLAVAFASASYMTVGLIAST
ncbi:MAG: hypothetical protein AAF217_06130 [Pseudomonadota bacterium]